MILPSKNPCIHNGRAQVRNQHLSTPAKDGDAVVGPVPKSIVSIDRVESRSIMRVDRADPRHICLVELQQSHLVRLPGRVQDADHALDDISFLPCATNEMRGAHFLQLREFLPFKLCCGHVDCRLRVGWGSGRADVEVECVGSDVVKRPAMLVLTTRE